MLRLYTYWRSSAAYRVRIALGLKDLDYEAVPVHLVRDGGEHLKPDYLALNPQGLVPTLVHDDLRVTQSLAIMEYLDEAFPERPLLPAGPAERARVRALAQVVACDMHPLNNRRTVLFLEDPLGVDADGRGEWYRHWVALGFASLESLLAGSPGTGTFCHGETPGLADACLVPQVYNALRFECDLSPYPIIRRINDACLEMPAFQQATPEAQPDAA